jgi:hypothetical protein
MAETIVICLDTTRGCDPPNLRRIAQLSSRLGVFGCLPLGLLLLAEDVPPLKFARTRILDWIEHRHPNWLVPERHK